MSYGQQPSDGNQWNQPNVPPVPGVPQAPNAGPYGSQGYGAAPAYGASPSPSAPQYGTGYGAPSYGQYGAPGAPWGGPNLPLSRPGTVTAGSILAFIGGGFVALLGLLVAALGGNSEFADGFTGGYGDGATGLVTVVGIVFVLIGGLVVLFGVMAFKGKRWGAIGLAVLAGLTVIGGISELAAGTGSGLFGVAWAVTGAVLLLVSSSQAWYRANA